MPIKMAGRAAQRLLSVSQKNLVHICSTRAASTDTILGWDNRLLLAQSSTIQPDGLSQRTSITERRPVDRRVQMHRLRNNFSGPGPGLKSARNRSDLVAEFYDLSKSVIDGRINVDDLMDSNTFRDLDEQMNFHIDIMSNNQVVNILASLIKMGVNPSTGMVKLLEHEVKFRINSISLSQVMKLVKFYNAIDTSYEQKQLTDILNNRIRSTLNNPKTTVKELVDIYNHLVSQSSQVSLLSLNEEKLLNLLTEQAQDEDDIVSQYIPKFVPYDYVSLCNIFVALAAAKRRPTPLLKATSTVLAKVPLTQDEECRPHVNLLIATLNSLVSLNYVNKVVLSRLVTDLASIINLDQMDLMTKCNLLRSVASLKWRSETLMKLFYDNVRASQDDVDNRLITTLIHVTAKLDYKPDFDFGVFYDKFIQGPCEDSIDFRSRRWLDHVWSLAMLGAAKDHHFKSVLNNGYIAAIESPELIQRMHHADAMKILNLRSIAKLENKMDLPEIERLEEFASIPMQRGADMQKFASRVREALNSIVESKDDLLHDINTPFGFVIDCVAGLDENSNFLRLDRDVVLSEMETLHREVPSKVSKLALIYVLFDEVIRNHPMEPIGHKRIISRILDNLGYRTVFLPEGVLNRVKTSADLAKQVKELMLQLQ